MIKGSYSAKSTKPKVAANALQPNRLFEIQNQKNIIRQYRPQAGYPWIDHKNPNLFEQNDPYSTVHSSNFDQHTSDLDHIYPQTYRINPVRQPPLKYIHEPLKNFLPPIILPQPKLPKISAAVSQISNKNNGFKKISFPKATHKQNSNNDTRRSTKSLSVSPNLSRKTERNITKKPSSNVIPKNKSINSSVEHAREKFLKCTINNSNSIKKPKLVAPETTKVQINLKNEKNRPESEKTSLTTETELLYMRNSVENIDSIKRKKRKWHCKNWIFAQELNPTLADDERSSSDLDEKVIKLYPIKQYEQHSKSMRNHSKKSDFIKCKNNEDLSHTKLSSSKFDLSEKRNASNCRGMENRQFQCLRNHGKDDKGNNNHHYCQPFICTAEIFDMIGVPHDKESNLRKNNIDRFQISDDEQLANKSKYLKRYGGFIEKKFASKQKSDNIHTSALNTISCSSNRDKLVKPLTDNIFVHIDNIAKHRKNAKTSSYGRSPRKSFNELSYIIRNDGGIEYFNTRNVRKSNYQTFSGTFCRSSNIKSAPKVIRQRIENTPHKPLVQKKNPIRKNLERKMQFSDYNLKKIKSELSVSSSLLRKYDNFHGHNIPITNKGDFMFSKKKGIDHSNDKVKQKNATER